MHLRLYYAPRTCALVPFVALTEAGAAFDVVDLNTRANQHLTPDFLRLNPKHKVPVLVIDGRVLTENLAIQVFIARQFPAAKLLPSGEAEFEALSLMSWITSTIHPHLTHFPRPENHCDTPGSTDGVRRVGERHLRHDFDLAESKVAGREWLFDHFTSVDAYLYWAFRRALSFGLDLSGYSALHAHAARVEQRPSVQRLIAHEASVLVTHGAGAR